jgi:hypothetical protein
MPDLRSYHYSSHHSFSQNLHPTIRGIKPKTKGYFGERRIISTKKVELKQQRLNLKTEIRHTSLPQTKPENITREKRNPPISNQSNIPQPPVQVSIQTLE